MFPDIKILQLSQQSSSRQVLPRSRSQGWQLQNTSLWPRFRLSMPEWRCCWTSFIIRLCFYFFGSFQQGLHLRTLAAACVWQYPTEFWEIESQKQMEKRLGTLAFDRWYLYCHRKKLSNRRLRQFTADRIISQLAAVLRWELVADNTLERVTVLVRFYYFDLVFSFIQDNYLLKLRIYLTDKIP
jgi:hypothetical protein